MGHAKAGVPIEGSGVRRAVYALGRRLRIEFYKYPEQRLHYWWEAQVVEVRLRGPGDSDADGTPPSAASGTTWSAPVSGVLVHMPLGFEFHHETKGRVFRMDHQAYVAFFPGRWYSGGPDLDAQGRVLEYYWNVQTPPVFEADRIWQYDLDLDVRCKADHTCEVWDRGEFEARKHLYPPEWVESALRAVEEIRAHVREGRWPVLPAARAGDWLVRP